MSDVKSVLNAGAGVVGSGAVRSSVGGRRGQPGQGLVGLKVLVVALSVVGTLAGWGTLGVLHVRSERAKAADLALDGADSVSAPVFVVGSGGASVSQSKVAVASGAASRVVQKRGQVRDSGAVSVSVRAPAPMRVLSGAGLREVKAVVPPVSVAQAPRAVRRTRSSR